MKSLFLALIFSFQVAVPERITTYQAVITGPKIKSVFDLTGLTCGFNPELFDKSGIVNPRILAFMDPADNDKACYQDIWEPYVRDLPLNNYYKLTLKTHIFTVGYDYEHDYSEAMIFSDFWRQDCPPGTPCLKCYKTPGSVTELHPNTPPGTFLMIVKSGTVVSEVKFATSAPDITMPGYSVPVKVGDVWNSEYCVE